MNPEGSLLQHKSSLLSHHLPYISFNFNLAVYNVLELYTGHCSISNVFNLTSLTMGPQFDSPWSKYSPQRCAFSISTASTLLQL